MTTTKSVVQWIVISAFYLILLVSIGYIAFWEQEFNKPENTVGVYVKMLSDMNKSDNMVGVDSSEFQLIIKEMMKKDADSSGDLQELATQSFHILLGALLAFLSASSTMIFQNMARDNRSAHSSNADQNKSLIAPPGVKPD